MPDDDRIEPMDNAAVKQWRRELPAGWRRQPLVTVKRESPTVAGDGDQAEVEAPASGPVQPEIPRVVADQVFADIYRWAQSSPEAFRIVTAMVRKHNPDAHKHLSDEQMMNLIKTWATEQGQNATASVYEKNNWAKPATLGGAG